MTTAALDASPPPPAPAATRARPGRRRSASLRKLREGGILTTLLLCGGFSLLTTLAIVYTLGREALVFFRGVPGKFDGVSIVEFLGSLRWSPLLGAEKHFGVWPLICGTVMITLVALAVAAPLGLVTAIWLSEYAPRRVRAILKPVLEILAGIPTVVLGFFALTVITPRSSSRSSNGRRSIRTVRRCSTRTARRSWARGTRSASRGTTCCRRASPSAS